MASQEPVAARVNGEGIPVRAVDQELAFGAADGLGWDEALDNLVDLELIRQEGRRLGVDLKPARESADEQADGLLSSGAEALRASLAERGTDEKAWRQRLRASAEADLIQRQALREQLVLSRQELQDHYWEHLPSFRSPAKKRLRQIYTRTRSAAEKAERELDLGEPFADVAVRHGQGPEAASGGLLDPLAVAQLPKALAKAAQALKPGERGRILASPWGYHILAEEARSPAQALSFEQAMPEARQQLLARKEQDLYRTWLGRLRSKAQIERLVQPTPVASPAPKPKPKKKKGS